MPVEDKVQYISDLNPLWPTSGDPKSGGDNHLRNTKAALVGSFPLVKGPVQIPHDQFVSKTDLAQAVFSAILPGQPGGTISYNLTSVGGIATWQPSRAIFDDPLRIAQVAAISLALS